MKRYVLVEPADEDLSGIWDYIAQDNISAANRVVLELDAAMQLLAETPNIGHRHRDLDARYRCWNAYSYLIIYRPDTSPLQIIRIIHGQRDLPNVLK